MYERTVKPSMQWVRDLLNADFVSGQTIPPFVRDAAERAEAARLQAWLVQRLAPLLITDPRHVAEQRRATSAALLHQAERRGWSGAREGLRRWLAQPLSAINATLQREREDGLLMLAEELSEWAKEAPIYPRWVVNDNQLPDRRPEGPFERRYQGGKKVLTVSQILSCPRTLKNDMTLNLGACLVSGDLTRLRLCVEGACGRYFYAGDFRQKCCTRACYERRDKAKAVGRMKRWRRNQRAGADARKA